MLVGMIVMLAVGALCLGMGLVIWRKQKISLVHDYHTRNVKQADVAAYSRLIGLGLIAVGAGCALTGVLVFALEAPIGWAALPVGFAVMLWLFGKAQKKYNGGIFS